MTTYNELLSAARIHYRVNALETLHELVEWLLELDAGPIDFCRFKGALVDEFVNERLVFGAYTIADSALLQRRATSEERENFVADPGDVFNPLEYGPENAEWTTYVHEVATMQRLVVVIERESETSTVPGNFRVFGAGQWLREALWAATGVVPRDPGAPSAGSELFSEAFEFSGRARFAPNRR